MSPLLIIYSWLPYYYVYRRYTSSDGRVRCLRCIRCTCHWMLWRRTAKCPSTWGRILAEARAKLDQPQVDYEATLATKLELARAMFERWGRDELKVRIVQP